MKYNSSNFALLMAFTHGTDHFARRMIPPLIPLWALFFGAPLWQVALLPAIQIFSTGLFQIPSGIISDSSDRRILLPLAFVTHGFTYVLFAIGATSLFLDFSVLLFGHSFNCRLLVMMLAVFLSGAGSSLLHPAGYPLITANIPPDSKGRAYGLWGSSAKFGDGLGPAVLGLLLIYLDWSIIFVGLGILLLIYAVFLFSILKEYDTLPPPSKNSSSKPSSFWKSDPRSYVLPILAILAYFSIRGFTADGIGALYPAFINEIYGYTFEIFGTVITSTSTASWYFSILLISAGLSQLVVGKLVDMYDPRLILLVCVLTGAISIATLALIDLSPSNLLLVSMAVGATLWASAPARDALINSIAPIEREGRTFAYLWTGALMIGSISPVFIGYIGDIGGLRIGFFYLVPVLLISGIPIALLYSKRIYVPSSDKPS
jgi:MFS family permease